LRYKNIKLIVKSFFDKNIRQKIGGIVINIVNVNFTGYKCC
jgi:hypothetical protein